jgi:hypothetical protein
MTILGRRSALNNSIRHDQPEAPRRHGRVAVAGSSPREVVNSAG